MTVGLTVGYTEYMKMNWAAECPARSQICTNCKMIERGLKFTKIGIYYERTKLSDQALGERMEHAPRATPRLGRNHLPV